MESDRERQVKEGTHSGSFPCGGCRASGVRACLRGVLGSLQHEALRLELRERPSLRTAAATWESGRTAEEGAELGLFTREAGPGLLGMQPGPGGRRWGLIPAGQPCSIRRPPQTAEGGPQTWPTGHADKGQGVKVGAGVWAL